MYKDYLRNLCLLRVRDRRQSQILMLFSLGDAQQKHEKEYTHKIQNKKIFIGYQEINFTMWIV